MNISQVPRKYNSPSIKEAIFEAKFIKDNFDSTAPGQIFEKIKNDFPNKQDMRPLLIQVGSRPDSSNMIIPPSLSSPTLRAFKDNNSEVVQVGPGIVRANRFKYTSWEEFVPTIRTILNAYIDVGKPQEAIRVSTRYINIFSIPVEDINIFDYFNLGVASPKSFKEISGFDITLAHKVNLDASQATEFKVRTKFLTTSRAPEEKGNRFILDIDCYTAISTAPRSDAIISLATQSHNVLTETFESIITDKTRDLMGVVS